MDTSEGKITIREMIALGILRLDEEALEEDPNVRTYRRDPLSRWSIVRGPFFWDEFEILNDVTYSHQSYGGVHIDDRHFRLEPVDL